MPTISVHLISVSAHQFGAAVAIWDLTHRLPQSVCSSCLAHTDGHPQDHRLTELLRLEGAFSGHLGTIFVNEEGAANVSYLGFCKTFDTASNHTYTQAGKIQTRQQPDELKTVWTAGFRGLRSVIQSQVGGKTLVVLCQGLILGPILFLKHLH